MCQAALPNKLLQTRLISRIYTHKDGLEIGLRTSGRCMRRGAVVWIMRMCFLISLAAFGFCCWLLPERDHIRWRVCIIYSARAGGTWFFSSKRGESPRKKSDGGCVCARSASVFLVFGGWKHTSHIYIEKKVEYCSYSALAAPARQSTVCQFLPRSVIINGGTRVAAAHQWSQRVARDSTHIAILHFFPPFERTRALPKEVCDSFLLEGGKSARIDSRVCSGQMHSAELDQSSPTLAWQREGFEL